MQWIVDNITNQTGIYKNVKMQGLTKLISWPIMSVDLYLYGELMEETFPVIYLCICIYIYILIQL
jgi:hypothetical protein